MHTSTEETHSTGDPLHEQWKSGALTPAGITDALHRSINRPLAAASTGHSAHVLDAWQAGHLYPSWGALNRFAGALELPLESIMDPALTTGRIPANADDLLTLRYDRGIVNQVVAEGHEYPAFTADRQNQLGAAIAQALVRATEEFAAMLIAEPTGPVATQAVEHLIAERNELFRSTRAALFGADPVDPRTRGERRLVERAISETSAAAIDSTHAVLINSTRLGPVRALTVHGTHVTLRVSASVHRRDRSIQFACIDDGIPSTPIERTLWLRALTTGLTVQSEHATEDETRIAVAMPNTKPDDHRMRRSHTGEDI